MCVDSDQKKLLTISGYTPYCKAKKCNKNWPKTKFNFNLGQFFCDCGWLSTYKSNFIYAYKQFLLEEYLKNYKK